MWAVRVLRHKLDHYQLFLSDEWIHRRRRMSPVLGCKGIQFAQSMSRPDQVRRRSNPTITVTAIPSHALFPGEFEPIPIRFYSIVQVWALLSNVTEALLQDVIKVLFVSL